MATKQQTPGEPSRPSFSPSVTPPTAPKSLHAMPRAAVIGPSLMIKGHITGSEDLEIDGKVEGPISLLEHELTVGPNAELNSEIEAVAVIIYGKVVGNVQASNRVDIKKDGSLIGGVSTARISIEDGAYFNGSIDVGPAKSLTTSA